MKTSFAKIACLGLIASVGVMPAVSMAQTYREHRQAQQNQWRNLGLVGAAVGIAGLITHNNTLAAAGLLGAGYSAYRYDQDRSHRDRWGYNSYRDQYRNGYGSSYGYGYGYHADTRGHRFEPRPGDGRSWGQFRSEEARNQSHGHGHAYGHRD